MVSKAIFAGGCFWGVQSAFEKIPGVISTLVGYIGGRVPNPTYMEVSSGRSGHAEAVEIIFDDHQINYENLLDVFFNSHDPTEENRQGPDIGPQYRSAIFYLNDEQRQAAIAKITELQLSGRFGRPVMTEVSAAGTFYPAEEYHQHYLQKRGQTCCSLRR